MEPEKTTAGLGVFDGSESPPEKIGDVLHGQPMDDYGSISVLISGTDGLGVETAKNLILSGFKLITLHHENGLELNSAVEQLRNVSDSGTISTSSAKLTEEFVSKFKAVVFTDISLKRAIELDYYCHNHNPPISFIKAEVRGLFGTVFCDFGPQFKAFDVHPRIATQVTGAKVWNFKPLEHAMKDPSGLIIPNDLSKSGRQPVWHLAFQALDRFKVEMQRYPHAGSEEDVQKLIDLVIDINSGQVLTLEEDDKKLLRNFAFGARAVLSPMAAMFGAIVGHEVLIACSQKFQPIVQFFYFDSLESLPSEAPDLKTLTRYDAQVSVFGSRLQRKLEEAKVFVVGSGEFVCAFVKIVARMGMCSGRHGGKLTILDDHVLNQNIGLARARFDASSINPDCDITVLQNRISPENIFDDILWENSNIVINSIDSNVKERRYLEQKCFYVRKALLNVDVSRGKCFVQPKIPHQTNDYGASIDLHNKETSKCSVHIYPKDIKDCIRWARSEFEALFEKTPAEVNAYLRDPSGYISAMKKAGDSQARCMLQRVLDYCDENLGYLDWARMKFEWYFANPIKELTKKLPGGPGAVSSGAVFPQPIQFSGGDLTHLQFIKKVATLYAVTLGDEHSNFENMAAIRADNIIVVPEFQPTADTVDEDAVINQLVDKLEECRKNFLPDYGFEIKPIQFDLENDDHIDLITCLTILRARSYQINPEVDKPFAKLIVIREIEAETDATSVAIATGLVCLEIFKVLDGNHTTKDYRNTFVDLTDLPLFATDAPAPPRDIQHGEI